MKNINVRVNKQDHELSTWPQFSVNIDSPWLRMMAELVIAATLTLFALGGDDRWLHVKWIYFAWGLSMGHSPDDGAGRKSPHHKGTMWLQACSSGQCPSACNMPGTVLGAVSISVLLMLLVWMILWIINNWYSTYSARQAKSMQRAHNQRPQLVCVVGLASLIKGVC